jgi:hypothetical protein
VSETFDVEAGKLLDKTLEIVRREVNNLFSASSAGKLSPTDSRDLIQYTKLLVEMDIMQQEAAKRLAADMAKPPTP